MLRRPMAAVIAYARTSTTYTDDDVGAIIKHLQHAREQSGVVLAVGVQRDEGFAAGAMRSLEAGI